MSNPDDNRRAVYQELCNSYRAIDDFRAKLLGFLPLATGTGILLLLDKLRNFNGLNVETKSLLAAVGAFGFVITLGLFAFKIYGIRKCHALILAGQQLEGELRSDGQFFHRPREVIGFINEPFAAGIIYPAVAAAWIFLALVSVLSQPVGSSESSNLLLVRYAPAFAIALLVLLVGLALSLFYNSRLKAEGDVKAFLPLLSRRIREAEEDGNLVFLEKLIADDFMMVRACGVKLDRKGFLEAVSASDCDRVQTQGFRTADQLEIQPSGDCAVVTCRVTTAQNKNGTPSVGQFWHTQVFIRKTRQWRCGTWQVTKICEAAL